MSEEYASCWVHQDCHVADVQKAALKKAAGLSGGKDECQVRLKGREHFYLFLYLDIGPGSRTQDSVVTCGKTTSYATEIVSCLDTVSVV